MQDHNQTYCALVLASVTHSQHLSQVAPIFSHRSLIDSLLDCICVFDWSKGLRCDCFHKMPMKTAPSNSLDRMKEWSHKSPCFHILIVVSVFVYLVQIDTGNSRLDRSDNLKLYKTVYIWKVNFSFRRLLKHSNSLFFSLFLFSFLLFFELFKFRSEWPSNFTRSHYIKYVARGLSEFCCCFSGLS